MQDKVNSLDDLKWSSSHKVGDITISIIQGKGCVGKRLSRTFEVWIWDSIGDIPYKGQFDAEMTTDPFVIYDCDLLDLIKQIELDPQGWVKNQRDAFNELG
jgi:hypothetical protein